MTPLELLTQLVLELNAANSYEQLGGYFDGLAKDFNELLAPYDLAIEVAVEDSDD